MRGSRIVNVSLGAWRTMTLRTKKDATTTTTTGNEQGGDDGDGAAGAATVLRTTQRIPLSNNSLFVMGLETNARWVHNVCTDKRPENT